MLIDNHRWMIIAESPSEIFKTLIGSTLAFDATNNRLRRGWPGDRRSSQQVDHVSISLDEHADEMLEVISIDENVFV